MTTRHRWIYLVLALAAALPARADTLERQLATKSALDAFFSMAQVQPEGADRQEPPKDFEGADGSEDALINYLQRQKRLGADLNGYRHLGTPLHHALRSGMSQTARWLLNNGADPKLRILSTEGASASFAPPDALGVAVSVGAWNLFDLFQRLPAFNTLSAQEQAQATWPYALDAADKTAMLLRKRIALPGFSTAPTLADELLRHSLCAGQPRLALALLRQPDAPAAPAAVRQPGTPCPSAGSTQVSAQVTAVPVMRAAEWKEVEDRLQWPVLPFLANRMAGATQAAQFLAAGARTPWSTPEAAAQYVWGALGAAPPAALAMLRAMPAAPLQVALHQPELMSAWLTAAADWPLADLRWALLQVDAAPLTAQLAPLTQRWSYAKATGHEAKDSQDRIARWTLLTDRLAAPLPDLGKDDGFLYWVPTELWPRWFKLGYRVSDERWSDWLNGTQAAEFEQAWPVIAQHQPALAQRSLLWLVAHLSVGPVDDAQALRLSYRDTYHYDVDFLRKAKYLQAKGLRLAQPRWLAAAFIAPEPEPGIALALAQQWVRLPPPELRSQVTRAPLECQARPDAALRRSLASGAPFKGEVELEAFQPLARPGQTDCAWLASSGTFGGRRFIDQENFGQGVQQVSGCADGSASAMIWNRHRSAWVEVTNMPEGGLIPVRLKSGGETAYVATEVHYGNCGDKAGGIFLPRFSNDGALTLEPLGPGHRLFDALALQCDLRDLTKCQGMVETSMPPTDALASAGFVDLSWPWRKEIDAFLAAIDRLDRAAMVQAREEGIFAHWLDEALRRVSASAQLSVPEKRQRIAWVQAQRTPRPAYAPETLDALLPWLPAEDWGPILNALRCNRYELKRMAAQAQERKLTALHRRLQAAQAAPCE
jgi:hypothetical protein